MPQYCLVKHRVSTYVIDGADVDRNPDRVPVTGVVTFEALLDKGDSVVVTEDGVATTITLAPIEARITNGEIYHRGEEGVKLFAGGPDTNPERIRYRAKFSNLIANGKKIELKDILFEAIPGGELILSMSQPVPGKPYPGYSATIEQGINQIEGARDEALGQVAGAVAAEVDAIKWDRGAAPNNDANLLRGDGMEGVWSFSVSGVNLPERLTGYDALVEVTHHTAANSTRQAAWSVNPHRQNESYERTYWAGEWGGWTARASAKAVTEALSGKADKAYVDAADTMLGGRIDDLEEEKASREEMAAALGEKADTSYVDAADEALEQRIDQLFPTSIRDGQVLRWDGTKYIPSWLDQHTDLYDDTY